MAVEQEAQILNDGDNFMAWECLRQHILEGDELPEWAARYFLKVARAMERFDPHEDDALELLKALEVKYRDEVPETRTKAKVDYDDIYWCVSKWTAEDKGLSVSAAIRRYVDESERLDREPLPFGTVHSAYYQTRDKRLEASEQDRPHFTREQFDAVVSSVAQREGVDVVALVDAVAKRLASSAIDQTPSQE